MRTPRGVGRDDSHTAGALASRYEHRSAMRPLVHETWSVLRVGAPDAEPATVVIDTFARDQHDPARPPA